MARPLSLVREHLIEATITAMCPTQRHILTERVVVIGQSPRAAMAAVDALWRNGMQVLCSDCGKPGRATSKAVVWQGPPEAWNEKRRLDREAIAAAADAAGAAASAPSGS